VAEARVAPGAVEEATQAVAVLQAAEAKGEKESKNFSLKKIIFS